MKSWLNIVALASLSCAVLHAQNTGNNSAPPENAQHASSQGLPCATPNPRSVYASNLKIPNSTREIKLYNVDYPETRKHDPVCLSKSADDTILWVSGSSKKFKLKVYADQKDVGKCGQHPFLKDPPTETIDGHFSGSLRQDVPDYCVYEVEFQEEDGHVSDPHIQTTP